MKGFFQAIQTQQAADFGAYLAGSVIVALVSIVRLPVLTAHFSPAEFGLFSLVSVAYSYFALVLYNWLNSCLYRYYRQHETAGTLPVLVSNLTFLFVVSSLLLAAVSAGWIWLASGSSLVLIILPAFLFVFTNQVIQLILTLYKLRGQAVKYNVIQSLQALVSFALILWLVFKTDSGIEVLFIAPAAVQLIMLAVLLADTRQLLKKMSIQFISRSVAREMIVYGGVGMVTAAGIYVLVASDRYLIAWFGTLHEVGLYSQVYQVGQVSVYFLVTVFFSAATPALTRILESREPGSKLKLMQLINSYMVLLLPVTFLVVLFSRQAAEILLAPPFREAWSLVPWIAVSAFVYGLTLFTETRLKFENRFRPVLVSVLVSCVVNIVLNLLLLPVYGYRAAAITTLLAYGVLFAGMYLRDQDRYLFNPVFLRNLFRVVSVLILLALVDWFIRRICGYDFKKWATFAEAGIMLLLYAAAVWRFRIISAIGPD